MNLIQSLTYGIEITEHVGIQKDYKFELSQSPQERKMIAEAQSISEALYLCDVTEVGDCFHETATTFDVSYKGQPIYQAIYMAEVEDYIDNLILINQCKTLKVNKQRFEAYRQR